MPKNSNAVALGSLGGRARASKLTKERKQEIARSGGKAKAARQQDREDLKKEMFPDRDGLPLKP